MSFDSAKLVRLYSPTDPYVERALNFFDAVIQNDEALEQRFPDSLIAEISTNLKLLDADNMEKVSLLSHLISDLPPEIMVNPKVIHFFASINPDIFCNSAVRLGEKRLSTGLDILLYQCLSLSSNPQKYYPLLSKLKKTLPAEAWTTVFRDVVCPLNKLFAKIIADLETDNFILNLFIELQKTKSNFWTTCVEEVPFVGLISALASNRRTINDPRITKLMDAAINDGPKHMWQVKLNEFKTDHGLPDFRPICFLIFKLTKILEAPNGQSTAGAEVLKILTWLETLATCFALPIVEGESNPAIALSHLPFHTLQEDERLQPILHKLKNIISNIPATHLQQKDGTVTVLYNFVSRLSMSPNLPPTVFKDLNLHPRQGWLDVSKFSTGTVQTTQSCLELIFPKCFDSVEYWQLVVDIITQSQKKPMLGEQLAIAKLLLKNWDIIHNKPKAQSLLANAILNLGSVAVASGATDAVTAQNEKEIKDIYQALVNIYLRTPSEEMQSLIIKLIKQNTYLSICQIKYRLGKSVITSTLFNYLILTLEQNISTENITFLGRLISIMPKEAWNPEEIIDTNPAEKMAELLLKYPDDEAVLLITHRAFGTAKTQGWKVPKHLAEKFHATGKTKFVALAPVEKAKADLTKAKILPIPARKNEAAAAAAATAITTAKKSPPAKRPLTKIVTKPITKVEVESSQSELNTQPIISAAAITSETPAVSLAAAVEENEVITTEVTSSVAEISKQALALQLFNQLSLVLYPSGTNDAINWLEVSVDWNTIKQLIADIDPTIWSESLREPGWQNAWTSFSLLTHYYYSIVPKLSANDQNEFMTVLRTVISKSDNRMWCEDEVPTALDYLFIALLHSPEDEHKLALLLLALNQLELVNVIKETVQELPQGTIDSFDKTIKGLRALPLEDSCKFKLTPHYKKVESYLQKFGMFKNSENTNSDVSPSAVCGK